VTWKLDYALVDATYRDEFVVNSPNHPIFEDVQDFDAAAQALIVDDGKLRVPAGAGIPGIARHMMNLGIDWSATRALRLGADLNWRGGVYLRGDESNLLGRTASYAVVNVRAEYRFSERLLTYMRVENLFDTHYESFGLLGEPDEVFPDFEDPRFLGAGPPQAAWIGVRLTF
jgi:outer membrane receptor protein involved in Fe transport